MKPTEEHLEDQVFERENLDQPKRHMTVRNVAVVGTAVLVLVGGLGYYFYGRSSKEPASNASSNPISGTNAPPPNETPVLTHQNVPNVDQNVSTVGQNVSSTVDQSVSSTVGQNVSSTVDQSVSSTVDQNVSSTVDQNVSSTVDQNVSPTIDPTLDNISGTTTATVTDDNPSGNTNGSNIVDNNINSTTVVDNNTNGDTVVDNNTNGDSPVPNSDDNNGATVISDALGANTADQPVDNSVVDNSVTTVEDQNQQQNQQQQAVEEAPKKEFIFVVSGLRTIEKLELKTKYKNKVTDIKKNVCQVTFDNFKEYAEARAELSIAYAKDTFRTSAPIITDKSNIALNKSALGYELPYKNDKGETVVHYFDTEKDLFASMNTNFEFKIPEKGKKSKRTNSKKYKVDMEALFHEVEPVVSRSNSVDSGNTDDSSSVSSQTDQTVQSVPSETDQTVQSVTSQAEPINQTTSSQAEQNGDDNSTAVVEPQPQNKPVSHKKKKSLNKKFKAAANAISTVTALANASQGEVEAVEASAATQQPEVDEKAKLEKELEKVKKDIETVGKMLSNEQNVLSTKAKRKKRTYDKLLKEQESLNEKLADLLNPKPVVVEEEARLEEQVQTSGSEPSPINEQQQGEEEEREGEIGSQNQENSVSSSNATEDDNLSLDSHESQHQPTNNDIASQQAPVEEEKPVEQPAPPVDGKYHLELKYNGKTKDQVAITDAFLTNYGHGNKTLKMKFEKIEDLFDALAHSPESFTVGKSNVINESVFKSENGNSRKKLVLPELQMFKMGEVETPSSHLKLKGLVDRIRALLSGTYSDTRIDYAAIERKLNLDK